MSPNRNDDVIRASKAAGLDSYPGVFTATEALGALAAGADALKFFPADVLGPGGIKGIAAILPKGVPLLAVGGVDAANIAAYLGCRRRGVRYRFEPLQAGDEYGGCRRKGARCRGGL